jgi:AP-4 complex subunit mu-1
VCRVIVAAARSYGQSTSTEALKSSVFNDPVTPPQTRARPLATRPVRTRRAPSHAPLPPSPLPPVANLLRPGTFGGESRAPPAAVNRSVLDRAFDRGRGGPGGAAAAVLSGPRRSEIFVDVVERLSVTFNSAGYVLTSEIDGAIQCKSFLAGNPQARVCMFVAACSHVCARVLALTRCVPAAAAAAACFPRSGWR